MTATRSRIIIETSDESLSKTGILSPNSDATHASAEVKKKRHHYSKKVWKRRLRKHKRFENELNYTVVLAASGCIFSEDFKAERNSAAPLKAVNNKLLSSGHKRELMFKMWKERSRQNILF